VPQMNGLMTGLNDLRERKQVKWSEHEGGWVGTPDAILGALVHDGYDECKRETTTSRSDCRPAGGVWQGVNRRTGSAAAAIWVTRAAGVEALLFIQIDGESVAWPGREPGEEEGGEG
jgi:hypothetical protein